MTNTPNHEDAACFRVKSLRSVMGELAGVCETLDALASAGLEDRHALEMLSRVVDGALATLDEIAERLEVSNGTSGEGVA